VLVLGTIDDRDVLMQMEPARFLHRSRSRLSGRPDPPGGRSAQLGTRDARSERPKRGATSTGMAAAEILALLPREFEAWKPHSPRSVELLGEIGMPR
jgi:hypothetical protein